MRRRSLTKSRTVTRSFPSRSRKPLPELLDEDATAMSDAREADDIHVGYIDTLVEDIHRSEDRDVTAAESEQTRLPFALRLVRCVPLGHRSSVDCGARCRPCAPRVR